MPNEYLPFLPLVKEAGIYTNYSELRASCGSVNEGATTVETPNDLVGMEEVMEAVTYSRKTLIERIRDEGVTVWIDGADRRRRMIQRCDLPKLTSPRPVERRETSAA